MADDSATGGMDGSKDVATDGAGYGADGDHPKDLRSGSSLLVFVPRRTFDEAQPWTTCDNPPAVWKTTSFVHSGPSNIGKTFIGMEPVQPEGEPEDWKNQSVWWWLRCRWWPGCNLPALLACVLVAIIINFAVPRPDELTPQAWGLLSVFVATILGLILEPLPTGGCALIAATVLLWSNTLTFAQTFSAFTSDTIWLIVSAYFLSLGISKTGLGKRLANMLVAAVGQSSLGMSYALGLAELVLSMGMPSTTARAGGIFVPLLSSLSTHFGSFPRDVSSRLLGSFLTVAQFQVSINTSAMFLTGAAQNALCLDLAKGQGVEVPNEWVTWLKGAVPMAAIGVLATPLLVYIIYPPKVKRTMDAPKQARAQLRESGPMSFHEWVMTVTFVMAIALWCSCKYFNPPVANVSVAFLAVSILLVAGTLTWHDCISFAAAWDTLFWFGVLISMSAALNTQGVIPYFAKMVSDWLLGAGLSPLGVFLLVMFLYMVIHYLFASQTAHVAALYPAFLGILLTAGVTPLLAAMSLAYATNLFGSMTHYASGQAAVYYGQGYLPMRVALIVGFIFWALNCLLWFSIGMFWWKFIGFYDTIIVT